MRIRLADKGLLIVAIPLFLIGGSFGAMTLHKQGADSIATLTQSNGDSTRLIQAKEDIENRVDWTLALGVNQGKNVGDFLTPPKKGTTAARTIRVVPLPGKKLCPDQVLVLDQNTAQILSIFSTSQIKKEI